MFVQLRYKQNEKILAAHSKTSTAHRLRNTALDDIKVNRQWCLFFVCLPTKIQTTKQTDKSIKKLIQQYNFI